MNSEKDTLLLKEMQKTNPELYSLFKSIEQDRMNIMSKASHKVKNVLSIASSSLQFIEYQHPETSEFNLWPQLKSSITYLVEIFEQEALYRHSSNLEIKPMNLQDLLWSIPDIMDDIYGADSNNSIRNFNYDISSNIPEINADYFKLKYALIEIIKNAYEATSDNDTITISSYIVDHSIAISIKDEGVGIDNNIINDITEPFFSTKKDHVGTGLSVVKKIALAHGGNLRISSDKCTCITITLPL